MSQEQIDALCEHVRVGRMNEMVALLNTLSRADLNKMHSGWKEPAMYVTAYRNKPDMVPVLAAAGADLNCKAGNGKSALQRALDNGYTDVAGLLIAFGATTAGLEGHENFAACDLTKIAPLPIVSLDSPYIPAAYHLVAASVNGDPAALSSALNHPKVTGPDMTVAGKTTALHLAAGRGHTACVLVLLVKGADTNIKDDNGVSALQAALDNGHTDVAGLLMLFGATTAGLEGHQNFAAAKVVDFTKFKTLPIASFDLPNIPAAYHLLAAISNGDPAALSAALNHPKATGPDMTVAGKTTVLHVAAGRGHTACAQLLLDKGANVNAQDDNGDTPLHLAVVGKYTASIHALPDRRANPNINNKAGDSPLHLATAQDHTTHVQMLIDAGKADVNTQDSNDNTPLHLAVVGKHTASIHALLDRRANPNINNKAGDAPLHLATAQGHTTHVQMLIDAGKADVNAQDSNGNTPLHLAVVGKHTASIHILLDHRANPNVNNKAGDSPLHLATAHWQGHAVYLQMLIDTGKADVNAQDMNGNTPLHLAASINRTALLQIFLDRAASVEMKNKEGNTPLHLTLSQGFVETSKLLLEHGANPRATNSVGRQAVVCAKDDATYFSVYSFIQDIETKKAQELEAKQTKAAAFESLAPLREFVAKAREDLEYAMKDADKYRQEFREAIGIDDKEASIIRSEYAFKVARFSQETVAFAEADLARAMREAGL